MRSNPRSCIVCGPNATLKSCKDFDYFAFTGTSCTVDPTPEPNPISWKKLLDPEEDISSKVIVDVRPALQHSIVRFVSPPSVKHIPVQELTKLSLSEVQERLVVKDLDTPVHLFCKTGVSSRQGVRHLLGLGFRRRPL